MTQRGRKPVHLSPGQRAAVLDAIVLGASLDKAAELVATTGRTLLRVAVREPDFRAALDDAIAEREANKERVSCPSASRYARGCRCDGCRQAATEAHNRQQAARLARGVPDGVPHGSASTYSNWGCRCEPCTKAQVEYCRPYVRAYYERRRRAAS